MNWDFRKGIIVRRFRTVLGDIPESELGLSLAHEHICCYFEYFYSMLKSDYLDKDALLNKAAEHLLYMKEKYHLSTLVDATPVNIGRDVELLKRVSEKTGVNIICSSGFYYTEEAVLNGISKEYIAGMVLQDIEKTNAGIIKFAVEEEEMSSLLQKLLSALCLVQRKCKLPLVIHTNGKNQNGRKILDAVLSEGVEAGDVTIGHVSDSDDMDYVTEILKCGCYVGFDRIYNNSTQEYYLQKARDIYTLCERGFEDKILLSHDGLVFNGFHTDAVIREDNPYEHIFSRLIPAMVEVGFSEGMIQKMLTENVKNMLVCR